MEKSSNLNKKMFLKSALNTKQYTELSLTPEGSDRRYTRIKSGDTFFILAESSLEQQELFSKRLKDFSLAGLNVPQLKDQDSKDGFLLLEDLGDQSLEKQVLESSKLPIKYYSLALNQIIKLQASQSMTLSVFSSERFFKEMKWSEKYLINNFFKLKLEKKDQKNCLLEWEKICKTLSSFLLKPAHRDYHSRNLFIKNKDVYLIDFQDAALFPRFYDLVSLLYDVYVKINADERRSLLDYFILNSDLSAIENKKTLEEEIRITAIQRLFKACGSFAGFYFIKKQDSHLKYILPALKLLEELLEKQNTYPSFLSLIKDLRKSFVIPDLN